MQIRLHPYIHTVPEAGYRPPILPSGIADSHYAIVPVPVLVIITTFMALNYNAGLYIYRCLLFITVTIMKYTIKSDR